MNGEKRDFPPISYLTLPTEKGGVISFLPFSSSLTNKSAHVTSPLETLKWLPCVLQKTSRLLTVTGKAHPDLVLLLLQPYFAQHFPPHSVVATQPIFGSVNRLSSFPLPHLCPCRVITCWLHPVPQISVRMSPAQRDCPWPSPMETSLLPSLSSLFHQYISEMIFSTYLLVL